MTRDYVDSSKVSHEGQRGGSRGTLQDGHKSCAYDADEQGSAYGHNNPPSYKSILREETEQTRSSCSRVRKMTAVIRARFWSILGVLALLLWSTRTATSRTSGPMGMRNIDLTTDNRTNVVSWSVTSHCQWCFHFLTRFTYRDNYSMMLEGQRIFLQSVYI